MIETLGPIDFERVEEGAYGSQVWTFCPDLDEVVLWIRLTEHDGIVVVSFHDAGEP